MFSGELEDHLAQLKFYATSSHVNVKRRWRLVQNYTYSFGCNASWIDTNTSSYVVRENISRNIFQ